MRRKIVLGLIGFSLFIFLGGLYIISQVEKTSSQLKELLISHQVEIMRRNFLDRLNRVQFDFYLINTQYARGISSIVSDVREMQAFADKCSGCHHPKSVGDKLQAIRNNIEAYKGKLSKVLTMRANLSRSREEEKEAYLHGEQLISTLQNVLALASLGLSEKTERSLKNVERTKTVLFTLLILGPILSTMLSLYLIRNFTHPIKVMLEAIRTLKNGDMSFRIKDPLKDEFAEMATAFNEMTHTIKEQMGKMQRTEQMAVCGQLAAGLAHEIKNPLAGIKAAIEVFSEELTLSRENQDTLSKIVSEIGRIETLMKSLLDFARPPKPQFLQVDLNRLLEGTIAFMMKQPSFSQNKTKSIEIVKELTENLPEIYADPQQLRQIFINLLLNACEAMPNGGTVTVRTGFDSPGSLQISISDTGKGVDKESIDKIFQPFFTTKKKGTGLGLSISKQLIEQHGGIIEVANGTGRGVTFVIKLPVVQPGGEKHEE